MFQRVSLVPAPFRCPQSLAKLHRDKKSGQSSVPLHVESHVHPSFFSFSFGNAHVLNTSSRGGFIGPPAASSALLKAAHFQGFSDLQGPLYAIGSHLHRMHCGITSVVSNLWKSMYFYSRRARVALTNLISQASPSRCRSLKKRLYSDQRQNTYPIGTSQYLVS